ncbi:hypothetical protein LPB136_12475 [Tenacibaculum todarodis]|uniref:Secretion system C-terminal sorting domain-containing protein n=1 Tax=Tenacibaculum todarodis TaxID=1850252 RepID=A0A1L3JLV4_9FLAO|nr:T9SS type A sorting domain-containing protein [Tenacibaculum todarodis]APG66135.1 hypothetical protein LPB136_12475 [Tenacibaculum todarodis]
MKKIITLTLFLTSVFSFGQMLENAPWSNNVDASRAGKPTLEEISAAAETYFSTIDINKKGSGYKPFKRWQYNWSRNLNTDGTIRSKEDLLKAWKQKKELNSRTQSRTDISNWTPLGPFTNSNTHNATNAKQTGQGRVNAIAVDPSNSNTYYVGTPAGGLWRSTNSGLDWTPLTDELPQIGVSGIAIHPTNSNIIYIATGDDDAADTYAVGVWKSIDGGTSWNNTGNIPGNPNSMNEIYIIPNSPETILVATSTGIHKTINGGTNWTTSLSLNVGNTPQGTNAGLDLKMKPGNPNIWYASSRNSFYKSTDAGSTFTQKIVTGLANSTKLIMDVTVANNNYVYLLSYLSNSGPNSNGFNGIYKSTNSGETFTKTNETSDIFGGSQAWYDLAFTVSSNDADILYVGVLDVWKSNNGGNSFTKINSWDNPNQNSYTHADIHFMRFIDGNFFAGTDGGIYVSTDEGSSFTDLTKNLAISQFYKISVSPQNYQALAGGLQDNGGFGYKNGEWRNYHGADGMEGIVDPNNEKKYYGFIQNGRQLHITENGGESRSAALLSPDNRQGEWVTPLASNKNGDIYAGYDQLFVLSGFSWTQISNQSFGGNLDVIEIDPINTSNIYVSNGAALYRSKDKGINFKEFTIGGNITSIEISNNNSNTAWFTTQLGVFKSENILDDTPTFTNITGNLPSESKLIVKHHERSGNNTIYVGTALGVYFINDDLAVWETFDTGLPNTQIIDLAINEEDSKLIAATYGRGIFISDMPRQLPNNDVRLVSINNPINGISCEESIIPEIKIKNQGVNTINSITINYKIDEGAINTFSWSGSLTSEEIEDILLPELGSLTIGSHTLNIEVVIADDTYSNNIANTVFSINENNSSPITVNTFESNSDELLTETSNAPVWDIGRVNKLLLSSPEGQRAYSTSLNTNYPDQTTAYLYTNCYDLSEVSNPELAFKMGFDLELGFDYLLVEYSTNFGAEWNVLGTSSDPNWYNDSATSTSQGAPLPGNQWTGEGENVNPSDGLSNATAKDYSYDLSAFTNETNIVFRFKFSSDQNTNEEGVVIDNLVINGVLSTDNFNLLNNIAIYPNPSDSVFNINWNTGEALNIRVFDITGKQVFTKKNITNNSYQLDLDGYAQGIYLLNMNMNGKTATKKIILK